LLLSIVVVYKLLEQAGVKSAMTVGHSLGEYSALVAANSIKLGEALPIVATRGKLMEKACTKGQGRMAAVIGLNQEQIEEELAKITGEIVDLANINSTGQIVISGSKKGIDQAETLLKDAGARRILPLNVSGPFHSRLMKEANEEFAASLNEVDVNDAEIPVYANVTAEPVKDR